MQEVAWTTKQRAADTVEAFGKRVVSDLMQHARMLMDAANIIATNPTLLDRRHFPTDAPANPSKLIALWLATRKVKGQIEDMTGHLLEKCEQHADTRAVLEALEAFRQAAEQEAVYSGSTRIPDDADDVMRDLIGKATNTRRIGDEVRWREGDATFTGSIIAIADGICAIGRMIRWKGAGGVGVPGIVTKPVSDLDLMRPELD